MRGGQQVSTGLPRPGKALIAVMATMVVVWVGMAISINYADVPPDTFRWVVGDGLRSFYTPWRFVTAALVHSPSAPWSLVFAVLALWFMGPQLEDRWGRRKLLAFLAGSAAFAFALQAIVGSFIPRYDVQGFFGSTGMIDAMLVAWALSNRGSQIRMMFVLPVSAMAMVVFIFVMNVLYVLSMNTPTEGLITPFGGMLAGYLFGDASPLRRFWLKLRLKQLQRQTESLRGPRSGPRGRAAASNLRVIPGGADRPKDRRDLN